MTAGRRIAVFCACGLLLGLLSGCIPRFNNPLSDEATSLPDEQLIGRWAQVHADGELGREWEVRPSPDAGNALMVIGSPLSAIPVDANDPNVQQRALLCTKLGDRLYLSLEDRTRGFVIACYEWTDINHVTLRQLSGEALGKLIATGALAGDVRVRNVNGKMTYREVTVLADTAELRAAIEKLGDEALCDLPENKPTVYQRVTASP